MKKLLFAVSALAALSLLAPSAGFAQGAFNQLGVYTDIAGGGDNVNVTVPMYTAFTAYLVVTNPYNTEFDDGLGNISERAVHRVSAFECQVRWVAGGGIITGTTIPNLGVNFGTPPDYIVGYDTPIDVVGGAGVLISWTILVGDIDSHEIFMDIFSSPSIPGAMAIADGDDVNPGDLVQVFPASGGFANPVFGINPVPPVVAIEEASWGNVKSLFR